MLLCIMDFISSVLWELQDGLVTSTLTIDELFLLRDSEYICDMYDIGVLQCRKMRMGGGR